MRSGAQTLLLLGGSLASRILKALADGPRQQVELRHETGAPAQTTLRTQLRRLEGVGAIEKRRRDRFPGALEYELTGAGRQLLAVAIEVERWLERAPGEPRELGSGAAKAAIKAFADGWSASVLRALAVDRLSLTELDRTIGALSYPALERRLAALRLAGQVEARTGNGRGTPYAVTTWGREGTGPLAAAALWERRHQPAEAEPIGRVEAETLFLLAAPLLRLPEDATGTCRLGVEIGEGGDRRLTGVIATAGQGRIEACTPRMRGSADAWALGSATAWLEAIVHAEVDGLECGGDSRLARALVDSMHCATLGTRRRTRS